MTEPVEFRGANMTVCLGWTDTNAAYLIADSAVTSGEPLTTSRTSFGERHYSDNKRSVEESALKIFRHGSTAATFAGNAETARDVFASYASLAAKQEPLEAFRAAWKTHGPFTGNRLIIALFAFWQNSPRLLHFSDKECLDGEVVDFKLIGNVTRDSHERIRDAIHSIPREMNKLSSRLQCMLSYMQSHSVYDYTIDAGIGGFYAGALMSKRGFQWIDPTIYVLSQDNLKSSYVIGETPNVVILAFRNDIAFCLNGLNHGWTAFTNKFGYNLGFSDEKLIQSAIKSSKYINPHTLRFLHVTFFNLKNNAITIFRINGTREMPAIHPKFETLNGKTRFITSFSEAAIEMLNRDPTQTHFLAFMDNHES